MKKSLYLKKLLVILLVLFSLNSFGQMLEPDDPGGDPVGEDPLGGGAPIGSGVVVLLTFGALYGAKKVYDIQNTENSE